MITLMRKPVLLTFLYVVLFLVSCKKNEHNNTFESQPIESIEVADTYADGSYCADVEYYNPNTGTRKTYSLKIDVEDNYITSIHWPNGGWMDDDHFITVELDKYGHCVFYNERGYRYSVQITGSDCYFENEKAVKMI